MRSLPPRGAHENYSGGTTPDVVPPLVRHGRPAAFRAHSGRGRPRAREAVQQANLFRRRGRRGDLCVGGTAASGAATAADCAATSPRWVGGSTTICYAAFAAKASGAASMYTLQLFYSVKSAETPLRAFVWELR